MADVLARYSDRPPSQASSDASHYDNTDNQIDRYGFYPEAPERRTRTVEINTQKQKNRRSVIIRQSIKRASDNVGLTTATDFQEQPKIDPHVIAKELERSEKWRAMAHRNDPTLPFEFTITSKLTDRVYKGIPDCWRASAWQSFLIPPEKKKDARLRAKIRRQELESDGAEDLEVRYKRHGLSASPFDGQIDLDVPRTISGHVLFRQRYQGGQRLLFRVLHAIALEFPSTGYVQGMASIAATLLCYYPEEQAFIMMTHLWTSRNLMKLYEPGFPHLLKSFADLERGMQKSKVGRHLLNINVTPMNFATRWYLTLFHVSLPFRTQLRVWDVFMLSRNPYKVMESVSLGLIEGMESRLLKCDFDQAMTLLTAPVDVLDDDRLLGLIRNKVH